MLYYRHILTDSPEFEEEIERYRQHLKDEAVKVYETLTPGASGSLDMGMVHTEAEYRNLSRSLTERLGEVNRLLERERDWLGQLAAALGWRALQEFTLAPAVRDLVDLDEQTWAHYLNVYFRQQLMDDRGDW